MAVSILVLDDEPWQLTWVKDIVRPVGGSCLFAQTYQEAVDEFQKATPSLVIIDIRIGDVAGPVTGATLEGADPSWVGLRFLKFVRVDQKSKIPAFVYTGLDREALYQIVENAYSARFYTKFEASYFREALEKEVQRLAKAGK